MTIVGYGIVGLIWGHEGRVDGALFAQYAPAPINHTCIPRRPVPQDLSGHIGGVETFRGAAESPDSVATRVGRIWVFPMIGEQPIFHT